MRFRESIPPEHFSDFDCASCQGKLRKCLFVSKCLTLKGPNLKTITGVTVENVSEKIGMDKLITVGLGHYGLCPIPIFDETCKHLFDIYNLLDGTSRLQIPDQIYELPAIYIAACKIIDRERARAFRQTHNPQGRGR